MKSGGPIVTAVAVAVLVAACSSTPAADTSTQPIQGDAFTLDGSVVIINSGLGETAQARLTRTKEDPDSLDCTGANAYEFLSEGQSVTIRNAESTVAGVGRLSPGMDRTPPKDSVLECAFTYTIPDIPPSPFYSIQYGTNTPIQYTAEELRGGLEEILQ